MKPEEKKLLETALQEVRRVSARLDAFLDIYYRTNFPDKIIFEKDVEMNGAFFANFDMTITDSKNIVLGTGTGTKFGTSASQKIGFLGATPIVRQGAIASPTAPSAGYVQAEAQSMKTAVDALRAVLTSFGFTA